MRKEVISENVLRGQGWEERDSKGHQGLRLDTRGHRRGKDGHDQWPGETHQLGLRQPPDGTGISADSTPIQGEWGHEWRPWEEWGFGLKGRKF